MLVLFMGFAFVLFRYEYTRIVRYGGGRGELFALAALMFAALTLGAAIILRWPVPNPADAIMRVFGPIGRMIMPLM